MMYKLYLLLFALVSFLFLKSQEIQQPFSGNGRLIHSLNGEDWELVSARPGVGDPIYL